jgi:hypothetical protein
MVHTFLEQARNPATKIRGETNSNLKPTPTELPSVRECRCHTSGRCSGHTCDITRWRGIAGRSTHSWNRRLRALQAGRGGRRGRAWGPGLLRGLGEGGRGCSGEPGKGLGRSKMECQGPPSGSSLDDGIGPRHQGLDSLALRTPGSQSSS